MPALRFVDIGNGIADFDDRGGRADAEGQRDLQTHPRLRTSATDIVRQSAMSVS